MEALRATGWDGWIQQQWCGAGRPLLGICLGMQLLASQGREGADNSGVVSGLDLIPGQVQRLAVDPDFVLPHVGWNALRWHDPAVPLAKGLPDGGDMYFVHSYAFLPLNAAHCLAFSDYGQSFAAVVSKGSCYGVQFHPEKSQRLGRRLLENFLGLTPC
jgi:glutamine amidotransferase